MKFSFLTYQFSRYSLEYCFYMAKEYGFDGVEIWGGRPHAYAWDMDSDIINRILNWKNKYNIEVSMYTPELLAYPYNLVSTDLKEREETVKYLECCIGVASALGTDKMQITIKHPGYGRDRREIWEMMEKALCRLCKRADDEGVDIILEPLSPSEGNIITCADDILEIQRRVKSPRLCSMIDIVPPFIAYEPYSEYFDKLTDKMKYVHICNCDGKSEVHLQINSIDGLVPIYDFFRIIKRKKYNGWCSLELLAPYFRDPELYLSEAKRIIDDICGELFVENN